MSKIPLLDGNQVDTDNEIDTHPDVDATDSVVLHADFAEEALPWWLDYETDNGPASPTFNGLASGDTTDVTISTGTTNLDDTTVLRGPTINWSNWSEIRFYAYGVQTATDTGRWCYTSLADAVDTRDIVEGFRHFYREDGSGGDELSSATISGGNDQSETISQGNDFTARSTVGFRIYEHDNGNGYSVDWVHNGKRHDGTAESDGFPDAVGLDLLVAIHTRSTSADRQLTIDGVYLELIP